MSSDDPADLLYVAAVLWNVGQTPLAPVIRAACDALVKGRDGMS